jgi:hypothetical protein
MNKPPRKLVKSAPKGTIWFGGPIDNCKLDLRIYGEDLVPKEITEALGHRPTTYWKKGDPLPSGPRVRQQSAWSLEAPETKRAEFDKQVDWIFSRLTSDVRIWRKLGRKFKMKLNAIIYLESWNRGFDLSPASMAEIGRRGLTLDFDIYFYGNEVPKWRVEKKPRTKK